MPSGGLCATDSYTSTDDKILSNVTGAASILVRSLVQGAVVGREVYVQRLTGLPKKLHCPNHFMGLPGHKNIPSSDINTRLISVGLIRWTK